MLIDILNVLQSEMTRPTSYGWVHLLSLALVIAITTLLILRFRSADERVVRRILMIAWVLMVLGELYKQLVYTYEVVDGTIVRDFQWYAFPYQFCSTPMYVLPFAIFLPEGRVRDAFLAFLGTFSLFGGLAVYAYPADVFISTIGVNIQTMLHHGLQIVIGVYLATRYYKKLNFRYYLKALAVFTVLVVVAMALNIGVHHALVANGIDETFNMFFISPYHECTLPVLSTIWPLVPYAVFLPMYVIGFGIVGLIIFGIEVGLTRLFRGKRQHAEA